MTYGCRRQLGTIMLVFNVADVLVENFLAEKHLSNYGELLTITQNFLQVIMF